MAEKKVEKEAGNLFEKLIPILLVASIGLAFAVGVLWQKVSSLEGGKGKAADSAASDSAGSDQPQRPPTGKLTEDQAKKVAQVSDDDHVRGSKDVSVFLIEYSDYECPFCSKFHSTAQQLVDEYEGKVAWVYRHFPLDQLHKNARSAAEASECVADLGGEEAFWKFTDALYKDQTRASDLASVASEVGVDSSKFQKCLDDGKYEKKVEEQYQGGLVAGVTGTPGNIILNEAGEAWLIPGALPLEQLKTTIDEALGS
jgi:protein-disulfide isomerase